MVMPTLRLKTTGEHVRSFLNLKVREIDRQIERGQLALSTIKSDLEAISKSALAGLEQAQARIARQPGMSNMLGGVGIGEYMPMGNNVGQMRNQIGRVENSIAELQHVRAQTVWLSERFVPTEVYDFDSADMSLLGITPNGFFGRMLGGAFAVGGDPFDVNNPLVC